MAGRAATRMRTSLRATAAAAHHHEAGPVMRMRSRSRAGGGAGKSPILQFEMPDQLPSCKRREFFILWSLDL